MIRYQNIWWRDMSNIGHIGYETKQSWNGQLILWHLQAFLVDYEKNVQLRVSTRIYLYGNFSVIWRDSRNDKHWLVWLIWNIAFFTFSGMFIISNENCWSFWTKQNHWDCYSNFVNFLRKTLKECRSKELFVFL